MNRKSEGKHGPSSVGNSVDYNYNGGIRNQKSKTTDKDAFSS